VSYFRPRQFIDFHVHVFPDDVAQKAMGMFSRVSDTVFGDGTVAALLRFMDAGGIDIAVPQPVAVKPEHVPGVNDWVRAIRSERIVPFGAIHPAYPRIAEEIDRLIDMGFRGVKLQPGWQGFYPDEEWVFPLYEALQGRLAVLFHAGFELDTTLVVRGTTSGMRVVRDKFPGLTMIVAHLGGYRGWSEAEEDLGGTGVYWDTSFCQADALPDDEFARLVRRHGTDKVVFASDFPVADPGADANRLCSLDLTQDEKEDIAWRNAARLLGME